MKSKKGSRRFKGQAGFTLLEAVMATGLLITGLAAVSNLMFVSIGSNTLGNRISTSAFVAAQKMEELHRVSFDTLVDSNTGSLDTDQAGYNDTVLVENVGNFHTRWRIASITAYGQSLKYIAVQTQMSKPDGTDTTLSRQSRAEFTSYRTCTLAGCVP